MDLHAGNLYWPTTGPKLHHYPPLRKNVRKQVAIIGGGMSGAIIGYMLSRHGISACLIERGEIAGGSTSANTGLLQYSNDIMLHELIDQIGEHQAVRFYKACRSAVNQLYQIASELPRNTALYRRSSLLYADTEQHLPKLKKEYRTLRLYGFDTEYLSADDLYLRFPFRKPGAIMTRGDAEVNPYLFVQTLVEQAVRQGMEVHEHTEAVTHKSRGGLHRLETADGAVIDADHVVYAIGYEPEELRGKLIKAQLNRSFAAVTAPQRNLSAWPGNCLIWDTADPYFYLRTTPDGRVVIGGLDENNRIPVKSEPLRNKRIHRLHEQLQQLFPMLDAPLEYSWSATFGISRDNLPFIGTDPGWPGVFYCLGYGGNGSVYSMIAANLLLFAIRSEHHPVADIVKLDRPSIVQIHN
ncbi:NAD(P)/FAD-dependent oxidoreductase [Paenibacillus pinihumi]|uniref:NAD(P)/FAD-dependent oxidoreductase n=1 Tax=Paenibacillus pinihumi TaxID=669462 RepID=UPI000423FF89|nr:FAD-dependent oxidoreductase [Paenibacillus pinihumi]